MRGLPPLDGDDKVETKSSAIWQGCQISPLFYEDAQDAQAINLIIFACTPSGHDDADSWLRFLACCCHAIGDQNRRPEGMRIMMWKSGRGTPALRWWRLRVTASAGRLCACGRPSPRRLKPDRFISSYGRPEGRPLQTAEFFRSLFSPQRRTGIASAKAHDRVETVSRSAEALLPPHKCGGSHHES
jgi:hypothetical protein